MLVLFFFIAIILCVIVWQDFKYRAVYWWLFPLLLMALIITKIRHTDSQQMIDNLSQNCSFLGVQLLFLSIYLSLKKSKWINLFDGYFGLGDLFFLISIAAYFSFINYLIFYLTTLFIAVILNFFKQENKEIPLAGQQALALLIVMVLDQMIIKLDLTSSIWLNNYLNF